MPFQSGAARDVSTAGFLLHESPQLEGRFLLPEPLVPAAQAALPLPSGALPAPTQPVATDEDPVARQAATSITTAVVEVISGLRGLAQLDGWVELEVLRLVERLRFRNSGRDLRLCSLRLQFPSPEVVEVCARLSMDGRGRAAALRICQQAGGWRATSLMIALPATAVSRAGRG